MLQHQYAVHQGSYAEVLVLDTCVFLIRSSILTGKYVHNHQTYENNVGAGCDAQSWRDLNEQKTMGPYMSKAGYTTGFFGACISYNRE